MKLSFLFFILVALFSFATSEWLLTNTGPVDNYIFPSSENEKRFVVILAKQNHVVAVQNIRSGVIVWKKEFSESFFSARYSPGKVSVYFDHPHVEDAIYQGIGKRVVVLNFQTGTKILEKFEDSGISDLISIQKKTLMIVGKNNLELYGKKGKQKKIPVDSSTENTEQQLLFGKIHSKTVDVWKITKHKVSMIVVSTVNWVVEKENEIYSTDIAITKVEPVANDGLLFELENDSNSKFLDFETNSVRTVKFPQHEDEEMTIFSNIDQYGFAIATQKLIGVSVGVYNTKNKLIEDIIVPYRKDEHGRLKRVFVKFFKKAKDNSLGYRLLFLGDDQSIVCLKNGQKNEMFQWQREEGLSSLDGENVLLKDLPFPPSVDLNFFSMVKDQVSMIPVIFDSIRKLFNQVATPSGSGKQLNNGRGLENNKYGEKKMIITYSKESRCLFAINSDKGDIQWKKFVPGLFKVGPRDEELNVLEMKLYSVDADHKESDNVFLVTVTPASLMFLKFDYLSGMLMDVKSVSVDYYSSFKSVNFIRGAEVFEIFSLNGGGEEEVTFLDLNFKKVQISDLRASNQYLREKYIYEIVGNSKLRVSQIEYNDVKVKREFLWEREFDDEIVLHKQQAVVSPYSKFNDVQIIPQTGLRERYLNPNLLTIVTIHSHRSSQDEKKKKRGIVLKLHTIDIVTGALVTKTTQTNVEEPYRLFTFNNLILYSFRSQKTARTQVNILEMFRSIGESKDEESILSNIVWGAKKIESQSSYNLQLPVVEQEAFYLPHSVTSISTTKTRNDINTKGFLLGLEIDKVAIIDRKLLNTQRSGVKIDKKTQHLLPFKYHPFLVNTFVSGEYVINEIRSVVSCGTKMESATMVFVIGTDILWTKYHPSGMFDSIPDDFKYLPLLLLIGVLLGLVVVIKTFISKREQRWDHVGGIAVSICLHPCYCYSVSNDFCTLHGLKLVGNVFLELVSHQKENLFM